MRQVKHGLVVALVLAVGCAGDLDTERRASDGAKPGSDAAGGDASSAEAGAQAACGDRETYYNGSCYLSTGLNSMTYQMAKDLCTNLGSKPVSIHSAAQNKFLYGLLFHMTSSAWIGLRREGSSHVWEDGKQPDYTNWAPGEPDSSDCAVMRGPLADPSEQGQWADKSCTSKYREVICQRSAGK